LYFQYNQKKLGDKYNQFLHKKRIEVLQQLQWHPTKLSKLVNGWHLRFLEKIAEIHMVVKVLAACKGAFYKGLKEYLTTAQQCYTTEERVYAAEQCDSGWKFLFRSLMDKA